MTVTATRSLTAPDYRRVKRFVRLALPEGLEYRTADHIAVLPPNDRALVERAARLLDADLETELLITSGRANSDNLPIDRPVTVRELLTHHLELQGRLSLDQLRTLAVLNPCPPERQALQDLAANDTTEDMRTLFDLIEDYPALRTVLSWPMLLDLLPQRRLRQYSISSAPAVDPRHVDLMVSLLEAPALSGRGTFRGTGSGYLNSVRAGDLVLARVKPCRNAFRIRHDTPVIMVAAGTGLAPFRGAIADRRVLAASGTALPAAVCYFGCDSPDADFLHADELRSAERAGIVALRPAFSEAPADGHRFVQHRITAEADELWRLLNQGARIYVCGDGRHMAPGVRDAFRTIYAQRASAGHGPTPDEWLQELTIAGRYVEDVYAG
ncbi:hypothetical protein [Nocardia sp. NPDC059239]|uniref:hypothetical protein n=1 Tax=unclassified Nocardia TaxID=2637762 RepID=UPI00367978A3